MEGSIAEWKEELRKYAARCRAANPLPDRNRLTDAQEWHCRIVGGSLVTWLRVHGPRFLQERAVLSHMLGIEPDPAIVFTSDVPGLVAAREIVGPDHDRIVLLRTDEFDASPPKAADPKFRRHVHYWSYFRPELEPEFAAEARAKHPIPDGCVYWQHTEGTEWATNAGRGGDHLWRWDGREPDLLEEAMSHWVS